MESKLARVSRESLLERIRSLSAEQRLVAFLEHCQLLARLRQAEVDSRLVETLRTAEDAH